MGNRATVIFTDGQVYSPAVYLHWNGGPESIYGFLAEMNRRGIRADDLEYGPARFIHIVGDYFDGTDRGTGGLSLGVSNGPTPAEVETTATGRLDRWNPGDNGIFIVNRTRGLLMVRRRVGDRWLTDDEVASERQIAEAHDYAAQFRAKFAELRPVVTQEG